MGRWLIGGRFAYDMDTVSVFSFWFQFLVDCGDGVRCLGGLGTDFAGRASGLRLLGCWRMFCRKRVMGMQERQRDPASGAPGHSESRLV